MKKIHYLNKNFSDTCKQRPFRLGANPAYAENLKNSTCLKCLVKNIKPGQVWTNRFGLKFKVKKDVGSLVDGVFYGYNDGSSYDTFVEKKRFVKTHRLIKMKGK